MTFVLAEGKVKHFLLTSKSCLAGFKWPRLRVNEQRGTVPSGPPKGIFLALAGLAPVVP